MGAVVYFLAAGDPAEFIRIGTSSNPSKRCASVAKNCPLHVRLLGCLVPRDESAEELESRLHKLWRDHRTRGDWFRGVPGLLSWINFALSADKQGERCI